MYTGDLKPDLRVTLSDDAGSAVDITTASVLIKGRQNGALLFSRAPASTSIVGLTSVVTMLWQATDTDTVGRIEVEVEVTWPVGKPQTFRCGEVVEVEDDFDA